MFLDSAELRLVVDYRKLNALTVPYRGTLPRIDDAYTTVRGAQVFSAIDLTAGYHQVRLPEEDVPKTSFRTPLGLFQFKVLPFGLRNAPQTFQAMMNEILSPLNEFCLVYMDDILVFSKTPAEHVGHVRVVLERLRSNRLYAKPRKCHWGKARLRFLGHVLSDRGLEVDPAQGGGSRGLAESRERFTCTFFPGSEQLFPKLHPGIQFLGPPAN